MPIITSAAGASVRGLGFSTKSAPLGSADNPAKNAKELYDSGLTSSGDSGYYYIKPANTTYYMYCDLYNQGGGWMLMMNIAAGSNSHVLSTSSITSTVNGEATVAPATATNKWSTTIINEFLTVPGSFNITWIEPKRTTANVATNSSSQWFQRLGDEGRWPNSLECNNYNNYINDSRYAWLWTGYSSASNAYNNIGGLTGNYAGSNHYAPNIYPQGQSFFSGNNANGIRFASPYNTTSTYSDGNAGHLWLKTF